MTSPHAVNLRLMRGMVKRFARNPAVQTAGSLRDHERLVFKCGGTEPRVGSIGRVVYQTIARPWLMTCARRLAELLIGDKRHRDDRASRRRNPCRIENR